MTPNTTVRQGRAILPSVCLDRPFAWQAQGD
jgi:hypothetical protein